MAMKQMSSKVGTSPERLTRTVGQVIRTSQRQEVTGASANVVMMGVPSEPDYKRGVTDAFKQMMPAHKNTGAGIVGAFAYRTNSIAWRDYNPGFFDGLFAPEGEYNSKPFYYTDLAAAVGDPSKIKTAGADELPVYGEAAPMTRSQARPASTQVIQDTDRR